MVRTHGGGVEVEQIDASLGRKDGGECRLAAGRQCAALAL